MRSLQLFCDTTNLRRGFEDAKAFINRKGGSDLKLLDDGDFLRPLHILTAVSPICLLDTTLAGTPTASNQPSLHDFTKVCTLAYILSRIIEAEVSTADAVYR